MKPRTFTEALRIARKEITRKPQRHEESTIQIACVQWFNITHPDLRGLLFSVPNGGQRNARTAQIMKAEGVVAGVADLILFVARQGFHALCIEMKTDKGKQSDKQKEWQEKAEGQGYKYVICRSLDDFRTVVDGYLDNNEWQAVPPDITTKRPYIPRPKSRAIQGDKKIFLLNNHSRMTTAELAKRLGCSESTIRNYVRNMKLKERWRIFTENGLTHSRASVTRS